MGKRLVLVITACLGGLGLASVGCEGGGVGPNTSACADDPRVTPYEVGLGAASEDGKIAVRFLDADPAPPAKGDNAWKIEVSDGDGNPVTGATIDVSANMPDHGHSSPTTPEVTAGDGAGIYDTTPMDLFMPGVWEVIFTVTPPGAADEEVVFTFCVDG